MASSPKNTQLSSDSDIELTPLPVASQGSPDVQSATHGEASSKPIVAFKAVLALLVSLVCFAVAVLVIVPSFGFSWHLGFQLQLVVIGALIGIQNLCLQAVLPNSLVLLEARLGESVIQNYDAILRNQVLGSHINLAWRFGLFAFSILPIAMGVAYKQFLGGTSSAAISGNAIPDALYGLAYPDLGQYASLSNSIFLSMNANSAFLNASRYDQEYPANMEFPWAYGYNTLVLGQDAAALLDLPEATYIGEIQGKLNKNETWQVSASVDAIVAIRNESIAILRHDTDFLNQTLHKAYNNFASQYLFQPNSDLGFGWMSVGRHDVGDTYCLMGDVSKFLAPQLYPISFVDSTSDQGFLSFMESAQLFSIRRQACQAKWAITQSEVKLLGGQCFNVSSAGQTTNSSLLHDGQTSPYALDILPVLVNTLGPYSTTRPNSKWKQISYVVAAANAWWARSAFLNFGTPDRDSIAMKYPETRYHPQNQTIMSTRSTLRAVWGLYLVVGALPLVTILTFLPSLLFYGLPIGRGFGLVSILAGIDRDSLDLVKGAGLSGELERQIRLDISSRTADNSKTEATAEAKYRIRYVLSRELKRGSESRIERGRTYE